MCTLGNMLAKWHWSRFTMEELLKFLLGDESVNKVNAAIEAEYDGTTSVEVLTDTDNDVEDSSSEEGSDVF